MSITCHYVYGVGSLDVCIMLQNIGYVLKLRQLTSCPIRQWLCWQYWRTSWNWFLDETYL